MEKNKEERIRLLDEIPGFTTHNRNKYLFLMTENSTNIPVIDKSQSDTDSEPEEDERCGWWCYRPEFLQKFRTVPWAILFLTLGALMQGITVNGLLHYVIATIEHRFNLHSSESGMISGSYDFASLMLLIPVTFFGGRPKSNKAKWIGLGLVILGIGALIFSLPYFIAPPKLIENEQSFEFLCNNSTKMEECPKSARDEHLSKYMWIFLIGNLLHGAGGTPLYTLAVTYIDEIVTRKKSSLCLGLFYSAATLGPALGYIFGGYLLQFHEDFLKFSGKHLLRLTPESKAWVGAWWIGFIICGFLFFIIALPILALPARLPGWQIVKATRVSETVIKVDRTKAYEHLYELPKAMCELLRNVSFVFLNLAGCCEGIIISGSGAFIPKIIQTQFHLSSKATAFVMGVVTIPSAMMGTMVGGGIVKKFELKFIGMLKLCICTALLAMLCASTFFFVCPNEKFAGVNAPYSNETILSINNSCNNVCNCKKSEYSPTCGTNNVLYFSPCHAGCHTSVSVARNIMYYYNCSCVNNISSSHEYQATNQPCIFPCPNLPHFLIFLYLTLFFTFVAAMPTVNATLRCVKNDQTSLAVGTQWMIVRLGGMVPGPILFGVLLDDACTHWLRTCDANEEGSCFMYDHYLISRYMIMLAYGWKTLEVAFFSLSMWSYKRSLRQLQAAEEIRLAR